MQNKPEKISDIFTAWLEFSSVVLSPKWYDSISL